MADSIYMPFGMMGQVGSQSHVLDGGSDPHGKAIFWRGNGWHNVTYRENVAPTAHPLPILLWYFLLLLSFMTSVYWQIKRSMLSINRIHLHFHAFIFQLFLRRYWLGCRKGIRPVKNWVVGCWRSCVWVKVLICIWLSWCHCHSLSLAPVIPDWFYLPGFTFLVLAHPGSPGQNPRGP